MKAHIARIVFPFALVVALAFVVKGYAHIGDGFSAGAVASLGAVLQLVVLERDRARSMIGAPVARAVASAGLVIVLGVLLGPVAFGHPPVTHFPRPGEHVTQLGALELHTAVLFDLGTAMIVYGLVVAIFDRMLPQFELGGDS